MVSIIIVSYNCKEFLSQAITSVDSFILAEKEIIVVDNASADNTVAEMGQKFPLVKFISNDFNAGFSAANNQGVQASGGDFILLLNPDAKLLDANVQQALKKIASDKKLIIGPKILNPDGSLQDSVIQIPTAISVLKEALFLGYFFSPSQKMILNGNDYALSGACLLMSRDVYTNLGGFDENLFWMDDVDLCYRARQNGVTLEYFHAWTVEHTVGVSSKKNYNTVISNQLISKLKFFKKNGRAGDFIFAAFFVEIHIFLRIILFLILSPFKKVFRRKLSAYLYAQSAFYRYIFLKENRVF